MKNKKEEIINSIRIVIKYLFLIIIPLYGISKFFQVETNKYSDILIVLVLITFIYLFNRHKEKNKLYLLLSFIYSFFFVVGTIIDKNLDYKFGLFQDKKTLILFLYSFTIYFYYFISYLSLIILKNKNKYRLKNNTFKSFIALTLILFLSYVPYLYSFYPGLLSPDSFSQISQAVGDAAFTNHHPAIHTLFISFCINIGKIFGKLEYGILIYSIFQTLIMSLIFSYFITFVLKRGFNKPLIIFIIGFYMFTPIFGFYSVTMWKDILFGCFALFLMIQIYKFAFNEFDSVYDKILLILSIILTGLFRSNGIYATLALAIVLFFVFKEKKKETLLYILLPSIVCFIIVGPIYSLLGIKKANFIETTAIPFEQICYVVVNDKKIDKESLEYIENVVDIDTIKKEYSLIAIDSVKFSPNFNNDYFNSHKYEFFKTWFKLLIKYPNYYIQCYLKSTYGFWYIESKGYSVHMWGIDEDNQYNLKNTHFEKGIKLIEYHNKFYYYPVIKYLLEPAFFVVTFLYAIINSFNRKKVKSIIPLLVPFLIWASIMAATPLGYQSRYVFALFTTFPFVVYILLSGEKVYERKK